MSDFIKTKLNNNGVCIISLKRNPINALSFNFLRDIKKVFLELDKNNDIHVIILKSDLNYFSAGADLKERSIMDSHESQKALDNFNDCFNIIEQSNKITICAINGYCLGGGAEMSLSFDIRLCSNDAIIGFPEVSIGIIPGAGGTQRLKDIIGFANSKYWIYTARKFSGKEARDYGFVTFLCDTNEDLLNKSLSIADEIISNAPIAIKSAKKAINKGKDQDRHESLNTERKYYNIAVKSKDRKEALNAFLEKRKPIWRNQ